MAQDSGNIEGKDRQPELESAFLDWLGSFGDDATVDDLTGSVGSVVDAAKDTQAQG